MKRIGLSGLLVAILLSAGCSPAPPIEEKVSAAAAGLVAPENEGLLATDGEEGSYAGVSGADLQALGSADALRTWSGVSAGEGPKASAAVQKVLGIVPQQFRVDPKIYDELLPAAGAEQRAQLGRGAGGLLEEIASRYALAIAEQSLMKAVASEAELAAIRDFLVETLPGDRALAVPKDPLALAPTEVLTRAAAAMQGQIEAATLNAAIADTPHNRSALQYLRERQQRLTTLSTSPEHKMFRAEREDIYDDIETEQWDAFVESLRYRRDSYESELLRLAEIQTGWREIRRAAHRIRGPPAKSFDEAVLSSVRDRDIDPVRWLDHTAKLNSWYSTENVSVQGLGREAALLALVDEDTLRTIQDVLSTQRDPVAADSPNSRLRPERNDHFQRWTDAARQAATWRNDNILHEQVLSETRNLADKEFTGAARADAIQLEFMRLAKQRFGLESKMPLVVLQRFRDGEASVDSNYAARVKEVAKQYATYAEALSVRTDALSPEGEKVLKDLKKQLLALYLSANVYCDRRESSSANVSELRKETAALLRYLPRGPPGSGPAQPIPPGSPKVPPESGGLALDPKFEAALSRSSAALAGAETLLAQANASIHEGSSDPPDLRRERGRRIVSDKALDGDSMTIAFTKLAADSSQLRLDPDSRWKGRLQSDGTPFPYGLVKVPVNFEPIGGGIHFGETAIAMPGTNLQEYMLTFESGRGLHFRSLRDRNIISVDSTIDGTSLKALHRFVAAHRNAAISVGWGSRFSSASGGGQPIYLDPFFADTLIGQQLLLADSIPWNFDSGVLPNGQKLSFGKAFKAAKATLESGTTEQRLVSEALSKYKGNDAELRRRISASTDSPITIETLNNFIGKEKAVASLMKSESASDGSIQIASEAALASQKPVVNRILGVLFSSSSTDEAADAFASKVYEASSGNYASGAIGWARKFFTNSAIPPSDSGWKGSAIDRSILNVSANFISSCFALNSCSREIVDVWIITCAKNPPCLRTLDHRFNGRIGKLGPMESTAALLGVALGYTTLAYLYDDRVEFAVNARRIKFSTLMQYRYATTHVFADTTTVRSGTAEDPKQLVAEIGPLTELVNANLDELSVSYPPISQTIRFAQIAALLRWASEAQKAGELAGIDFSELGRYGSRDTKRTPTPDAMSQ